MKKRIMAGIMAAMMVLTMMQTTAFAGSEKTMEPSTETMCGVSDDTPDLSSQEEGVESGGKPGEADASFDTEYEQHAKTEESSETVSEVSEEALSEEDAIAPIAETNYEVSNNSELIDALSSIQIGTDTEATIVLKADVTVQSTSGGSSTTFFGVDGKHITVKSEDGEMKKLIFPFYGILSGDCTFDNVNVIGSRLFCNGYRTNLHRKWSDPFERNTLRGRIQNYGKQFICCYCSNRLY